ncbi:PAS domain S-box protein [Sunxiuqinia sp. sy24]|uniref:PAS domain S-box protein n=1 Tax=Sunxiuqinia sp. sy24 TaxID=3461495 RepID=UPI00404657A7
MDNEREYQKTIRLLKKQIESLTNKKDMQPGDYENSFHTYESVFDEIPLACSLHKIQYDKHNRPIDFTILKVNPAFELATGKNGQTLKGQSLLTVFSALNPKWVSKFAAAAKSGKTKKFTEFSFDAKTYFDIQVHSDQADYFVLMLTKQLKNHHPDQGPIHFYERLMDHLHEGIWVTDKNDTIFFANSGISLNTGLNKKELIGKSIHSFEKKELGNFLDDYLNAKQTLKPLKYETHLLTIRGEPVELAGWLVPLIKNHRFDGMICTTRNISDDKRNRQIIRESEEKLRNIIEHSTNVFYSHSTDHILTYISPQMKTLLGYTPEEAMVKWTSLTSGNPINDKGFKLVEKAVQTGQMQDPYELELVHKDGHLVWVQVHEAPVVTNGKTSSIVGALTDITEQREIAQKLVENQQGLRHLLYESPIPIAVNSKDGLVEYLNREFTHTFGYTTQDIPNVEQWFEKAYPDQAYREKMKERWQLDLETRINRLDTKVPFEAHVTCKDGSIKFVQIRWSFINEKLVLILNDLTEHKRLEEQILHKNDELQNAMNELQKLNKELQIATKKAKESDELKSAFLANMSHEIRTPMNSIIGFSSLLDNTDTPPEKQRRYTSFIQKSGNHLLRIIDDIIDIAKIESNQLKIELSYFSIVPFLQNTYDYHRQSSLLQEKETIKLRLNCKLATKSIIMFSDPIRLKQVFDNLLTNSIKNTTEGFIELGIHQLEENSITFYVTDTGIGIPEQFKEAIFKRFTQVESKTIKPGTGLGLSIIKGITNLLHGEIWFESTENVGSTFYVKFPILPKE